MYMVSLVASRLYMVSLVASRHLATHLILALIINRRNYLDARTAFTLLCIGIKILIQFCNV